MLKTFALIVRRPDIDRDTFRTHYEEVHSPLALPLLEGLVRYVKYHVLDDLHGQSDFDVISAFWYRDAEAAMGTMRIMGEPAGAAIRADELTFMDKPRNTFFAVAEERKSGSDEPATGSEQSFVLVKAPAADKDRYLKRFDEQSWSDLLDVFGAPQFALANQVLGGGDPAAWDRVIQIDGARSAGDAAQTAWARAEEARGARVLVVRTRMYETETPWEL